MATAPEPVPHRRAPGRRVPVRKAPETEGREIPIPEPKSFETKIPGLFYPGRIASVPPIWREGRVAAEYLSLVRDPVYEGHDVPEGDGRPVILIPGFMAGDNSLAVMADWLRRIGYYVDLAGITFNVEYSEVVLRAVTLRLQDLHAWKRRRVTLIGHSRGGLLAKVLAHRHPDWVEQVIGLGAPLGNPFDVHPLTMAGVRVAQAFNFMRHRRSSDVEKRFLRDLAAPVKVPTTSIYTRTDGIVHWQACRRDDARTIEVHGSHVGLGLNPEVYKIVSRLLPWPERAQTPVSKSRPKPRP